MKVVCQLNVSDVESGDDDFGFSRNLRSEDPWINNSPAKYIYELISCYWQTQGAH